MSAKTSFRALMRVSVIATSIWLSLPPTASSQTAQTGAPNVSPTASADAPEIEAVKSDLKQMRVILNQMANNLAFVSDSQSPLKHQFQLDIDMWQVLMMQMQRRVDRIEQGPSKAKPAQ